MSIIEAIILGIVQGLTEFLPVSSSGHLELAQHIFGVQSSDSLQFSMVLHGATVLSTIVVFWSEIVAIIRGVLKFQMNRETIFAINIAVSLIPILIVGLLFKDQIEAIFTGSVLIVGVLMLLTAALLTFSSYAHERGGEMTKMKAFIIGIAQSIAVLPGISRSGATISTGLLLGIKREEIAKFSFLMVLIPIIGMNFLELFDMNAGGGVGGVNMVAGFIAAFVTGTLACKWMIKIVSKGKLIWFALYCAVVGLTAIGYSIF